MVNENARRIDGVRRVELIEVGLTRGKGTQDDEVRYVQQYWQTGDGDGVLMAEKDVVKDRRAEERAGLNILTLQEWARGREITETDEKALLDMLREGHLKLAFTLTA